MSSQGSLVTSLARERELLRSLNTALISLEAENEGKASALGFSEYDVSQGRQTLLLFLEGLGHELSGGVSSASYQPLVTRIKESEGSRPVSDWVEDIEEVSNQLKQPRRLDRGSRKVLADVVGMLDQHFSEDLKRLRYR